MQRPLRVNQLEDSGYQFLPLVVAYLTKYDVSAKVFVAVRIAAGTVQWTLFRNFNRKGWSSSGENCFPGSQNIRSLHLLIRPWLLCRCATIWNMRWRVLSLALLLVLFRIPAAHAKETKWFELS